MILNHKKRYGDHSRIQTCDPPFRRRMLYSTELCDLNRDGATSRNRTRDLRFTKPLLYQLSYSGLSLKSPGEQAQAGA
jgi:hypothetical protein